MIELLAFGPWLKKRRRVLDLTQAELARQANCSPESIRKIESADLKPSKVLAQQLAAALAVPPAQQEAFVAFARAGDQAVPIEAFSAPGSPAAPMHAPPSTPAYHALPRPLTSFVGRTREMHAAVLLLRRPDVALLTLSGPPGAGKTRLSLAIAQQVVDDFADGVCYVPLAAVADAAMVLPAIAQALGVQESTVRTLLAGIVNHVREKHLLLVLDNFEQVVAAAPDLTELLSEAPRLKALVSSRAVLKVYGEHEFPVPPLGVPPLEPLPALEQLAQYPSIELLIQRAQHAQPDFELNPGNAAAIAHICATLDGLPLAIEMAAARVKWTALESLLQQLRRHLSALSSDARNLAPRQRTLRGAIDWSYDLLAVDERRALTWLSVCAGGCTVAAAQSLLSDKMASATLESLVEKSLLRLEADDEGVMRCSCFEMIRDYAREKLEAAGELVQARDQHLAHFLRWAEYAMPLMQGAEQAVWFQRMQAEHDNLRAAADWALASRQAAAGLRLASGIWQFWIARGHQREWLQRLTALLALSEASASDNDSARARLSGLTTAGFAHWHQGELNAARALLGEALTLARTLGDRPRVALVLRYVGLVSDREGDAAAARESFEESLHIYRSLQDSYEVSWSLAMLGDLALRASDDARARPLYEEGAALLRALGNKTFLAYVRRRSGQLSLRAGNVAAAIPAYRESLELNLALDDRRSAAACLIGFANIAAAQGRSAEGMQLLSAATAILLQLNANLLPADQAELERSTNELRTAIDPRAFADARAEGEGMTLREAVEMTLSAGEIASKETQRAL